MTWLGGQLQPIEHVSERQLRSLIADLDPARVRANLEAVQADLAAAAQRVGRDPADVEICAATKYVSVEGMAALAEAGVALVGENRAQDLEAKAAAT